MATINIITSKINLETLITEDDVKVFGNSSFSSNISEGRLKPNILIAQELYIKPILGTILYSNLFNEFKANNGIHMNLPDGTIGGTQPIILDDKTNYKELYGYVKSALIHWSVYISLPFIYVRVAEAGVVVNFTDNSETASLEQFNLISKSSESIARQFTSILNSYLHSECGLSDVDRSGLTSQQFINSLINSRIKVKEPTLNDTNGSTTSMSLGFYSSKQNKLQ